MTKKRSLNEQPSSAPVHYQAAPLKALAYVLCNMPISYSTLGPSTWREGRTPNAHPIYKLYTATPPKAERPFTYWPTPLASQDSKPLHKPSPGQASGSSMLPLPPAMATIHPDKIGEYVNPCWVEPVMGFREGYTDCDRSLPDLFHTPKNRCDDK